jgi:hypothetical protein
MKKIWDAVVETKAFFDTMWGEVTTYVVVILLLVMAATSPFRGYKNKKKKQT